MHSHVIDPRQLAFCSVVILSFCLAVGPSTSNAKDGNDEDRVVRVFVLAGQSNMEGKAKNQLLEHQAQDESTSELFAHLREGDGWIVRDDCFIKFLNRHGPLTVGYGSPDRTGVELEFGHAMADHFDEPVLLIKTAWGGHSLFKLFRSPSAGMPSDEALEEELTQAQNRVRQRNERNNQDNPLPTMEEIRGAYGSSYRNMMQEVKSTLSDLETLFPELEGATPEISGFVWFQGWNDQYGAEGEYASNMEHFIRDVRRDLGRPDLPFVIGVMGQNGSNEASGAMLTIQEAQLAMEDVSDFQDNVRAVRTDVLVDRAAEELYPMWRENFEEWEKTGSDFGYHYMGSAIWFNRIGREMGNSMLELLD